MSTSRPLSRLVALAAVALPWLAASATAAPLGATSAIAVDTGQSSTTSTILGDFNADGKDDLVISSGGRVHVVFGAATHSAIDLAASNDRVRTFTGVPAFAVDAAGDFDGDGFDDIIAISENGTTASIVYGSATSGGPSNPLPTGELTTLNTGQLTAPRIAGAGDVNGDGFDDVLVTWNASNNNQSATAIVYGGPRVAQLTVNTQNARTSLVRGPRACWWNWIWQVCTTTRLDVTPIGDFNGDGKDDLFVDTEGIDTRTVLLGRTGTFTLAATSLGSVGTVKLSPRLAAIPQYGDQSEARRIFGAGDVDDDGYDDLVVPVRTGVAGQPFQAVLRGRPTPPATLSASEPVTELAYDGDLGVVAPAGDQGGSSGDDLVLGVWGDNATYKVLTDVLAGDQPGRIAALPSLRETPVPLSFSRRTGDLDGDGETDLLASATRQVVALTHGADHYAPELRSVFTALTPRSFPAAAGTKLSINASTDAEVELSVSQSSVLSTSTRSVRGGDTTAVPWLPTVGGQPLPVGVYRLTLTPTDAAGNRGPSVALTFTVTDPPPAAAVDHKTTVYGPGGAYAGNLSVVQRWRCPGELEGSYNGNGVDLRRLQTPAQAGDLCSLSATFNGFTGTMPPEYAQCTWKVSLTFNGVPQTYGLDPVRLVAGQNTLIQRYDCETPSTDGGPPPTSVTDFAWRRTGSASIPAGAGLLRLTTATANETGSAFWPEAIDWRERTVEFTARMSGGSGAAEGLTLAFLPASGAFPAGSFLGGAGGKLGFGGLDGTAIALDVFKQSTDPASSFVGIAQGTTATSLNYLSWADPGVRLRSGVITVKVVSKAGVVTVFVNGKQRLSRTLSLPASGYLGFTAATGSSVYQQTEIRSIAVTPS